MVEAIKVNVYGMFLRHVYEQKATERYEGLFMFLEDMIEDSPQWFMKAAREFPNACWCVDQFNRGKLDLVKLKAEDESNTDEY